MLKLENRDGGLCKMPEETTIGEINRLIEVGVIVEVGIEGMSSEVAPGETRPPHFFRDDDDDDELLQKRLAWLNKQPKFEYRTGEVAEIIGVSRETVRLYTNSWEPKGTPNRNPVGLFSTVLHSHRRIPHHALAEWMRDRSVYGRSMNCPDE